jgi:hypothetical protein
LLQFIKNNTTMTEKKEKPTSVKIGGRNVNLTSKGLPNLRELTKEERTIVKEVLEKKNAARMEEKRAEIMKALNL